MPSFKLWTVLLAENMSCNIVDRSDGWLLYRPDRSQGNCKIEKIRTQNLFCLRIGKGPQLLRGSGGMLWSSPQNNNVPLKYKCRTAYL